MYKKYIKKKGKKIGPYYYDSIRLKNGKVKTIYLGRDVKKAKKKLLEQKKVYGKTYVKKLIGESSATKVIPSLFNRGKNSKNIGKNFLVGVGERLFVAVVLLMMLFGFVYFGNVGNVDEDFFFGKGISGYHVDRNNLLTGDVVGVEGYLIFSGNDVEKSYEENVDVVFNSSSELAFDLRGIQRLVGLKFNGRIVGNISEGNVKVFLENKDVKETLLVFDSDAFFEKESGFGEFFEDLTGAFLSLDEGNFDNGIVVDLDEVEETESEELEHFGDITGFFVHDDLGSVLDYEFEELESGLTNVRLKNSFIGGLEFDFEGLDGKKIGYNENVGAKGLIEPENVEFTNAFGVDLREVNFTNASVGFFSGGDYLYKCDFWDFDLKICLGNWNFMLNVTDLERINVVLEKGVVGFAEGIFKLEEEKEMEEQLKENVTESGGDVAKYVEENLTEDVDELLVVANLSGLNFNEMRDVESYCKDTCFLKNFGKGKYVLKVYVNGLAFEIGSLEFVVVENKTIGGSGEDYGVDIFDVDGNLLSRDEAIFEDGDSAFENVTNVVSNVIYRDYEEETIHAQVVINSPVKWKKKILFNENMSNAQIKVPVEAEEIVVKKILENDVIEFAENVKIIDENGTAENLILNDDLSVVDLLNEEDGEEEISDEIGVRNNEENGNNGESFSLGNLITGNVVQGNFDDNNDGSVADDSSVDVKVGFNENLINNTKIVLIEDVVEEIELEYETPGPVAYEENTFDGKRIIVSSEIHYENVLTYTKLPDVSFDKTKLYRIVDGVRILHNFTAYDNNENGKVDYIEWITPSLSNETFEVEIVVVNVQSFPTVGGDWVVKFNTKGVADLIISVVDGTTWSNSNYDNQLKFRGISCSGNDLDYDWIDGAVVVENYSCVGEGKETSLVLVPGKHILKFEFGGNEAYAYNSANDFKVQRGTLNMSDATETITAGTDYTAPTNLSQAFVMITNTANTGAGKSQTGGGTQAPDDVTVYVDGTNLTKEIIFNRLCVFCTAGENSFIAWEIIEYIGPDGGDNEIIVRDVNFTTYGGGSSTVVTHSINNVANQSKVVPFITGQASPDTSSGNYEHLISTTEYNTTGNNDINFTRAVSASSAAVKVSWALVEFVGKNWEIQRVEHTYSAAGAFENESITVVNNVNRAFLHVQKRIASNLQGLDEFGHNVWISGVGNVTFVLQAGATNPSSQHSVAYVIENTQTDGVPMVVTRSNGEQTRGDEPSYVKTDIGKVLDDLTIVSINVNTRCTGTGTAFPRAIMGAYLINESDYNLFISDTGQARKFRTEVVEWPSALATISLPEISFVDPTPTNASTQNHQNIFVNVSVNDSFNGNFSLFVDFDRSLVGWWRMDDLNSSDDPTDYLGLNNGSAKNGAVQTDDGYLGKGFEFDGVDDVIDVGNENNLNITGNITIAFWVNATTIPAWPSTSRTVDDACSGKGYYIHLTGTDIGFDSLHGGTVGISATYGSKNLWNHIVATVNSSSENFTMNIYLNGTQVKTKTFSGNFTSCDTQPTSIGSDNDGGSTRPFNGTIDDFMIFNRTLSADEVMGLYANSSNRTLEINYTGLDAGDYKFRAYVQNLAGNVNNTEERIVTIDVLDAPSVTLNAPANDSNYTSVGEILINATITDPDSGDNLTVRIYGSNGTTEATIDNDDLIYFINGVSNNTIVLYNWTVPVLDDDGDYLMLLHLDNNIDFGENASFIYNFASSDGHKNGTLSGGGEINLTGGKLAGAYNSSSAFNDMIEFDDYDDWIGKKNITYLGWLNTRDVSGEEGIINKHTDILGGDGFAIHKDGDNIKIKTNGQIFSIESFFVQDEWVHFGIALNDTGGINIYKNGELNDSSNSFTSITANSIKVRVGASQTGISFNGLMDEIAIVNRTLNSTEMKDTYRLRAGEYHWKVNVTDESGLSSESEIRTFTLSAPPFVSAVSLTPSNANVTSLLNCTFIINDDYHTTISSADVIFYNGTSIYQTFATGSFSAGVEFSQALSSSNVQGHFEEWLCSVRGNDTFSSGNYFNSTAVNISNSDSGIPTLNSPDDGDSTTNRTPKFIWTPADPSGRLPSTACEADCVNTSDPDNDAVTYKLNLTCINSAGGFCDDHQLISIPENVDNCDSGGNGFVDNEDTCSYTLTNELKFFDDDGYFYNWSVHAEDSYDSSSQAEFRKFDVDVYVGLKLVDGSADFVDLLPGNTNDTSACDIDTGSPSPCPIKIENDGNVEYDVNVTGPSRLWDNVAFPHTIDYFSIKVGNGTEGGSEVVSYNIASTNLTYVAFPAEGENITIIKTFNHTDSNDNVRLDINLTVPDAEPTGNKSVSLSFTGYYVFES